MRYWKHIDDYLDELEKDIYEQPPDEWHTKMATEVINKWIPKFDDVITNVLDVGCGQGFCQSIFELFSIEYEGVTLGKDAHAARDKIIYEKDFTFLPYSDETFDLIFSRHSLEHSPMPLLTLMEWYRVSNKYLCLIIPKPDYCGFHMQNHYSVMYLDQIKFLLNRAGWEIMLEDHDTPEEYRFMCKKVDRP